MRKVYPKTYSLLSNINTRAVVDVMNVVLWRQVLEKPIMSIWIIYQDAYLDTFGQVDSTNKK